MQIVDRLRDLHGRTYLHRDLKPENILVGTGKKSHTFYLIDFGLAKRYICPKTGNHIPKKLDKGMIGSMDYMSLNAHMGLEQSRRDDLESLGYIMIYLLNGGKLPWDLPDPELHEINL